MIGNAMPIILIIGSLATLGFMLWRIRAAKAQIKDSIFWIVFSALLLVISIFPGITEYFSKMLQFEAPINFVYLLIIFILLIQQFSSSMRISQLDARVQQLTQRLALSEKAREDAEKSAIQGTPAPENDA